MNDDQFTKLFKYIEEFRVEVNGKLDLKAPGEGMGRLITTLGSFVKRVDDNEIEQSVRDAQFERLLA